jgi:hypothetical protein
MPANPMTKPRLDAIEASLRTALAAVAVEHDLTLVSPRVQLTFGSLKVHATLRDDNLDTIEIITLQGYVEGLKRRGPIFGLLPEDQGKVFITAAGVAAEILGMRGEHVVARLADGTTQQFNAIEVSTLLGRRTERVQPASTPRL